jgi:iron complex outermembrane receptor protein
MKVPLNKVKLILSIGLLCAGWGVHLAAHAQVATSNAGPSPSGVQAAHDNSAAADDTLQEVVVTGTSIRGAPPVGSNVISVGREDMDETGVQSVQQLLKLVPAVTGMGSAGQGGYENADSTAADVPTIHGVGGVASDSTLVLIDGHRIPLSGILRNLADPNIVPPNAIERLDVMPEGASSIYGSDAVAGVINLVTRKRFSGFEVNAQGGDGDRYHSYNAGFDGGKTWDGGYAFLAYSHSYRSALSQADRPYTLADHLAAGGSNFGSFACSPATVQPKGTTSIYSYPYTGAPASNAQRNAPCDSSRYNDLLPEDTRDSLMLKLEHELTDKLTAGMDVVYSSSRDLSHIPRGAVTATVFGPGSANANQINPFFEAPAGVNTNVETVRFDAQQLLGSGAQTLDRSETFYAFGHLQYRLGNNWLVTANALVGSNESSSATSGTLCTSCALLALNGTVNQNGTITSPSIFGTGITVVNSPLTLANSLDPFRPAATNRTSAQVLAGLTDSLQSESAVQTISQYALKADGPLFALPAGEVKLADGIEYTLYDDRPQSTVSLSIGPSSTGSQFSEYHFSRDVKSAYAEVLVPLVGPAMAVPFVRRLELNISGRYDDYKEFGSTTNPKFALNWQITDGLKLRGNIARSFVAPAMTTVGANLPGELTYFNSNLGIFQVPLALYPAARQIPACATAVTTCAFNTAAVPGIQLNGPNSSLKPETGRTWSIGMDATPSFIPNLSLSATYWHNDFMGGVTSPIPALALNSPGFASSLRVYPNGATPAQVAAFAGNALLASTLPSPIYFTYDFRSQNVLNLTVEGIDAVIHYSPRLSWGSISSGVAATYFTRYDQQVGVGSPVFSVLNTTGFNSTFPSVRLNLRAELGVQLDRFAAVAYLNYTGAFKNWGSTAINPVVVNAEGVPVGGGDNVGAYTTVDAHVSYSLGATKGTQVFVDVTNLLNRDPPFVNRNNSFTGLGYDAFTASPLGRVVVVGVRTKF